MMLVGDGNTTSSLGDVVPSVKEESKKVVASGDDGAGGFAGEGEGLDKDLLCPICMQVMKDAFLTACGHSFCYMCIVTHLNNKKDCPCCSHYLTDNHLFPNFLLDKVSLSSPLSLIFLSGFLLALEFFSDCDWEVNLNWVVVRTENIYNYVVISCRKKRT